MTVSHTVLWWVFRWVQELYNNVYSTVDTVWQLILYVICFELLYSLPCCMYLSRYTIKYVRNKRAFAVVHGTRADSLLLKYRLYWLTECKRLQTYLLTTHSGSKWQKLAKNRFITVCLMRFHEFFQTNFHYFRFRWLLALHFQNLSNCCSQFHGFFNLIFGGIFAIWPNCTTPRAFEPFSASQLGFCRPLDLCYLTSFTAIRCCDGVIFHINFAVRLTALHSLVLPAFLDLCYLTSFTAHTVDFI